MIKLNKKQFSSLSSKLQDLIVSKKLCGWGVKNIGEKVLNTLINIGYYETDAMNYKSYGSGSSYILILEKSTQCDSIYKIRILKTEWYISINDETGRG